MSTLKELLNKHCPNGVEFKKMSDICKSIKTGKLDANAMEENGKYRFYTCAKEYYKINTYAFDCEALLISGNGANVGYIHYYKGKFNAYQRTYVLTNFTENILYIKYFLDSKLKERIDKEKKTGNTPYIRLNTLTDMIIPVPPIEVQKEIVRILDEFTEKTTKLQELLHRETILRKKQYEYYRDKLLTFDDNIEFKSLSECILNTNNIKWNINQDKKFKYIDLSSVSRENNQILECQVIDYETAPSRAQQIVIKDDVIFGTTRPMLKRMCIIPKTYDNQICSTGFCVLRANKQIVLPKWILYCISTKDFFIYVDKNQKGASYPAILDKEVKKYKIPVPPLEEQERIVNILDKFDALCNDITRGLPAEIEMRKKQYEYYRDKLLTFKEKKK